jgi:hypothetical protein
VHLIGNRERFENQPVIAGKGIGAIMQSKFVRDVSFYYAQLSRAFIRELAGDCSKIFAHYRF